MYLHHAVAGMALVRFVSAGLEFSAAMLMLLRFRTPVEALRWVEQNMLPYYRLGEFKVPGQGEA